VDHFLSLNLFGKMFHAMRAWVSSMYRCPNSAGRTFSPWHDTNLARSKHGPAQSVTDPGRHGPFSGPGMSRYDGPRGLARPGPINGPARRRPAYLNTNAV
jgi:hypothetical protein